MAQANVSDVFRVLKLMMCLTGIWPKRNPTPSYRILGFLSMLFPYFVTTILVIEIFRGFPNTTDVVHCVFILVAMADMSAELTVCSLNGNKLHRILDNLDNPALEVKDDGLLAFLIRNLQICKILIYTIPSSYVICLVILRISPEFDNEPDADKLLSIYGVFRIISRFTYVLAGWNLACINCIFMTCVLIAIAYLDILYRRLKLISEDFLHSKSENFSLNDNKAHSLLKEWIVQHIAVERYIRSTEEMFTYNIMVYSITCAILNCTILLTSIHLSFTSYEFLSSVFICMVLTSKLSIYCVLGQVLITTSLKISNNCYMFAWDSCGPVIRKNLCFVIQRSQRPFQLTAGKFAVLSYETLATMLKTTYTFFGVLSQLYGKRENP